MFFLFVSYYFLFLISMYWFCWVGAFEFTKCSHSLPTFHCWQFFTIIIITILIPFIINVLTKTIAINKGGMTNLPPILSSIFFWGARLENNELNKIFGTKQTWRRLDGDALCFIYKLEYSNNQLNNLVKKNWPASCSMAMCYVVFTNWNILINYLVINWLGAMWYDHGLKNNTRLTQFINPTKKKSVGWRHSQSENGGPSVLCLTISRNEFVSRCIWLI